MYPLVHVLFTCALENERQGQSGSRLNRMCDGVRKFARSQEISTQCLLTTPL
jgi:hypothetical protein